jgi:two-component system cell cycle response regulator
MLLCLLEFTLRALIIDVSKSLSVLLNQHCAGLHLATETHTSGSRALKSYQQAPFDLVCVALQLSDMDGISFARKLQKLQGEPPLQLILIGDIEDPALVAEAHAAGVTNICQPFHIDALLDQISNWVVRSRLVSLAGTVLYVEADPAYATPTINELQTLGYRVKHVRDVVDALTSLKTDAYDLLITDYVESDRVSGLELIQTIRSQQQHPLQTPILVLANMADKQKKIAIMQSGANDFVDKDGPVEEFIVRVGNLVQNRNLYQQALYEHTKLQTLAMTDQLTGIHNRHYLFNVAPQKISESRRHQFPISLVIIDLDKFKLINDNYGHDMGDQVLRAVGNLLHQQCRREDLVARFGGEEFVLLLTHCGLEQAAAKADKIRLALMALRPENLDISASFGVAGFDTSIETTFRELFGRADTAVYLAKTNGRNRVEVNLSSNQALAPPRPAA